MMNLKFIVVNIFLAISCAVLSNAQELPALSYFMNNRVLYNPAAAGTNETQFTASLAVRPGWAGTSGLLWAEYKFIPYNMAAAISVFQDRIGANVNTNFMANYAYHLYLTKRSKLSLGLSAGAVSFSFGDGEITNVWDEGDQSYLKAIYATTLPKFGFGVQYYNKQFFASLSIPDIVMVGTALYQRLNEGNFFQRKRNYVAMAGYNFKISDKYVLNPNVLFLYHPISGAKVDANLQVKLLDYFWIGATYSTSGNHNLMAGTQLSSRMRFGYAYIFINTNATSVLSTHEVNLVLFLDNLFQPKQN
ncbi:MAG: PorP/SprF family type IX secretion system membrane protein [Cytophagales bacterium]